MNSFGSSVAVFGDTAVVGANAEDGSSSGINGLQNNDGATNSGAAYVFVRQGTNWSQQAYLKASNPRGARRIGELGDGFGFSVTISGDLIVVGAHYESSTASGVNGDQTDNIALGSYLSGAAYVFVRSGTNWTQQAYLKASNPASFDRFGHRVAASVDTVAISSLREDSNATGINGNQASDSAVDSGAAYVFVRSGTNWTQRTYLKASNTGTNDQFGQSLALSGDTVVAGAFFEDGNGTGLQSDQNDNSAVNSGAAYVFAGLGVGPSLRLTSDGDGGYFVRFTGAPDCKYRLEHSASPAGPWTTIDTQTAPASGLVELHDLAPLPGHAFYRTAQP